MNSDTDARANAFHFHFHFRKVVNYRSSNIDNNFFRIRIRILLDLELDLFIEATCMHNSQ